MRDKIKEAFDAVRAEESIKRSTRAYLYERIQKKDEKSFRARKRLIAVFASLAILLLGTGGYGAFLIPVSAISIDVNPSVELGLNSFDRVISVEGFSEDGEALAAASEIKYMNYLDALDSLMSSEDMAEFLNTDAYVSITVASGSEGKSAEMLSRISACEYANGLNVECFRGSSTESRAAHGFGMSIGKYTAFLELQALDPEISPEAVRSMTMRQIRERIAELSGTHSGGGEFQGFGGGRRGRS